MERSGLFLDAPNVLGDAAKAACGTRYRDCVSWDYAGLIKLPTRSRGPAPGQVSAGVAAGQPGAGAGRPWHRYATPGDAGAGRGS